jgi:alkylhydroperoxidase family enzyme
VTVHYAAAIRTDLAEAHRRAWDRLARPGSWWTGAERVAIAAETRHAMGCALCARRKAALSPYAVAGSHDHLGALPDAAVEAIHAIVAHPSRLTRRWYQGVLAGGLSDGQYVELVGVVAHVTAIDTFCRGIGVPPHPLPASVPGTPSRYCPSAAKQNEAWVPNIAHDDHGPDEADLFRGRRSNIRRALTLVPDEARGFFDLVETQYLPGAAMTDFAHEYRAITHAQVELVAARVSALNQCFY